MTTKKNKRCSAEVFAARAAARYLVEEGGHDFLYFQQVVHYLQANGHPVDADRHWGGTVFKGDGDYWMQIGTVYVGDTSRNTNSSYRGLWAPRTSTKYCVAPSEDVMAQGRFDLRNGQPHTKNAKQVLMWLDTQAAIHSFSQSLRISKP